MEGDSTNIVDALSAQVNADVEALHSLSNKLSQAAKYCTNNYKVGPRSRETYEMTQSYVQEGVKIISKCLTSAGNSVAELLNLQRTLLDDAVMDVRLAHTSVAAVRSHTGDLQMKPYSSEDAPRMGPSIEEIPISRLPSYERKLPEYRRVKLDLHALDSVGSTLNAPESSVDSAFASFGAPKLVDEDAGKDSNEDEILEPPTLDVPPVLDVPDSAPSLGGSASFGVSSLGPSSIGGRSANAAAIARSWKRGGGRPAFTSPGKSSTISAPEQPRSSTRRGLKEVFDEGEDRLSISPEPEDEPAASPKVVVSPAAVSVPTVLPSQPKGAEVAEAPTAKKTVSVGSSSVPPPVAASPPSKASAATRVPAPPAVPPVLPAQTKTAAASPSAASGTSPAPVEKPAAPVSPSTIPPAAASPPPAKASAAAVPAKSNTIPQPPSAPPMPPAPPGAATAPAKSNTIPQPPSAAAAPAKSNAVPQPPSAPSMPPAPPSAPPMPPAPPSAPPMPRAPPSAPPMPPAPPSAPPMPPAPPSAPSIPPAPPSAPSMPPAPPSAPSMPPAPPSAPSMPPAPPSAPSLPSGGTGGAGRGALLSSIQGFRKGGLRKVAESDKHDASSALAGQDGKHAAAASAASSTSEQAGGETRPPPMMPGGGGLMAELLAKQRKLKK